MNPKSKLCKILLSITFCIPLSFASCTEKEPQSTPVESLTLNSFSVEMTEGDEITLIATVKPDNATNKSITWMSSDKTVVTVTDGKVTAIHRGSATITATTIDGGHTSTCSVTVAAKVFPVESITLDKSAAEMILGDEIILTATVKPDNATNKSIIWTSSDKSVATVTDGKVTAVNGGTTTITATTEDGGLTAECEISVIVPVQDINLSHSNVKLVEGDEFTLSATVKPDNATNKSIIWTSSDKSVATVTDGKVTAVNGGTTTITATTEDGGLTAECEISVIVPVQDINLSHSNVKLVEGDEFTLSATVIPDNATNKEVTWRSSDESVVTVSKAGVITAIKAGDAIIYASTDEIEQSCNIEVYTEEQAIFWLEFDISMYLSHTGYVSSILGSGFQYSGHITNSSALDIKLISISTNYGSKNLNTDLKKGETQTVSFLLSAQILPLDVTLKYSYKDVVYTKSSTIYY